MDNGDIVMTTGQTTHPLGHGWDFYDKMPAGGPDFVGGFDIPTPSPHRFNIVNDISNQAAVVGSNNDSTSPPDLEESNRVMEQHFDFESAANSPGSLERKPTRTSPTSAGLDCHSGNGTSGVAIESPARRSRPLSESLSGDAMRHVSSAVPSSPAFRSEFQTQHRHSHRPTSAAAAASSTSLSRSYEASDVDRAIRSMRIVSLACPLAQETNGGVDSVPQQTDGHWPVDESSVPGSMQVSPLATMMTRQSSSSPTAYFSANPSTPIPGPAVWDDVSPLVPPQSDPSRWIEDVDSPAAVLGGVLPARPSNILMCGPVPSSDTLPPPADSRTASNMRPAIGPRLSIHPMSFKSRVETQVPITLYLHPMPPGVTKLHLPTYTISKPKFIANPPPPKSSDTLELVATVVCSNATINDDTLRRVFARAASVPGIKPDPGAVAAGARHMSSEGSPSTVNEGGTDLATADGEDVKICSRCIDRERKRAARKKNWSIEEQEIFNRDEHLRIVVFNTSEIQEWEQVTHSNNAKDAHKLGPPPNVPSDAMEVCLPMRIACYCRHHNEKLGFRVIFTLKDYQGALVAQAVTDSIMITDDHKTNTSSPSLGTQPQIPGGTTSPTGVLPPQLPLARHSHGNSESSISRLMASGSQTPTVIPKSSGAGDGGTGGNINGHGSNAGATPNLVSPIEARFTDFPVQLAPMTATSPFRMSHSSSDLLSLRKGEVPPLNHAAGGTSREWLQQNRPVSFSVRNSSGQSLPSGPATKKRKPSKEARVPPGLIMTRIDNSLVNSPTAAVPPLTPNTSGAVPPPTADLCMDAASLVASSYTQPVADLSHVLASPEYFSPPAPGLSQHAHFSTGPPTPSHGGFCMSDPRSRFIGSTALPQAFSAPTSARHSRAPSPTGVRASAMALHQSQMAQALANGLVGMTGMQQRQPALQMPRIYQIIPAEGPCSGDMEVSCLGEGFCRGMEVMFGDTPAIVTRRYYDRLLICRPPPSVRAGDVLVQLRHERPQQLPLQTSPPTMSASSKPVTFRYLDNQDQQLMKTALTVIGQQMTGTIEEATDVARRILRDNGFATNGAAPAGISGKNSWN